MKKKNIALLFWIIVLITAVGLGMVYLEYMSVKWNKKVILQDYNMSIKYPNAYEDIVEETSNVNKVSSNLTITEIDTTESGDNSNYMPKQVEKLIEAKSEKSGLTILVEGLQVEKTDKELEDICKDYIATFKAFNSSETVAESNYEFVTVNGHEAGKVNIYVHGKTNTVFPGIEAYLISLDDREITIVFSGTKKLIEGTRNRKEIEKIISSVELY